ncbi:NAD(P)-binding protein [Corynespora cassiicola Philippines]|uniref:NAD(P)-binding protein n=1 Tax=Corynespora cassiicola Philippines TaxID=1448308 RepID=A0A2T2P4L3_CORCC|nr:NAD(P)-binding protein [Corynespora cassiicola Philippines]
MPQPILRIGIIGCGEIAQVVHINTLNSLSTHYQITYLCDPSPSALSHCASMVHGPGSPQTTHDPATLCASPTVDAVLICTSDESHVPHGILALQNDKWTLIEKPLALCYRDIHALIDAERQSKGKVFVGTMRRYAPAFLEACKEVRGMQKIQYARVRALIGPNPTFVAQSCTYPRVFDDYGEEATRERKARETEIVERAMRDEFGVEMNDDSVAMFRMLGWLNIHDFSAMREIIGMPKRVLGASLGLPGIYTVLFEYEGFAVTFESGFNSVPTFDAHIEVYSEEKIVRVNYDTPFVKGLPVSMTVREKVAGREGQETFGFQERTVRRTYEDPFTLEMLEFYDCVVNGKKVKTSAEDSIQDLDLWKMVLQAGEKTYKKK